jgi:pimeloyl-ACP methyl ester carboxylesterase
VPPEESSVLVEGPWNHRDVTAGGVRFHVAETGPVDGPLVVLLHGFPEFWWSWRHQLVALGAAGFHAVAPDLRGYGATDKPPRGYDMHTLSADVAGLIRALGAPSAALVGHDYGGYLAWTAATLHPRMVTSLAVLGATHPVRLRQALREPAQAKLSGHVAAFQVPKVPERRLASGELVSELLDRWGGPGFPDAETDTRCRQAMAIPAAAHCALEWYRWSVRSQSRTSGWRYHRLLRAGVRVPVLQVHGALDGVLLRSSVEGSQAFAPSFDLRVLPGVGHFVHEEAPELVSAALLEHLRRPATP